VTPTTTPRFHTRNTRDAHAGGDDAFGDTQQVEYDTEAVVMNQTEVAEEMNELDEIDQREAETLAEDLTFYQEDQVRSIPHLHPRLTSHYHTHVRRGSTHLMAVLSLRFLQSLDVLFFTAAPRDVFSHFSCWSRWTTWKRRW
jgi:hypothetical protein